MKVHQRDALERNRLEFGYHLSGRVGNGCCIFCGFLKVSSHLLSCTLQSTVYLPYLGIWRNGHLVCLHHWDTPQQCNFLFYLFYNMVYYLRDLRLEKNPSNSEHTISEHRHFRAEIYFSEQKIVFRAQLFSKQIIFSEQNYFFQAQLCTD